MKYHKGGPACGRIPYDLASSEADCECPLYTESTVAVLLRGRAHGTLKIAVDDENCETACGEIPVRIFTGEWTELKGEIRIPAGVHAVYFRYVGSGWVDFAVFEFVERK